ncbi:MAG: hypothetical protein J0L97_05260 [Alphaproteobacteria bacterium]|nr:hypothetical protein [Alphaproteobacteria bacterium]
MKQDWQSYLFFYHAMISEQPGTITRIASGCTEENKEKLAELFDQMIASMTALPGRFRIHFTPDYSNQKEGADYKYWNKPFGTKHWMEHVLGFPHHPQNKDAIVILMDPDQVIQRPFVNNDFSDTNWIDLEPHQVPRTYVDHGKPAGQLYGFGLDWKRQAFVERILRGKPSPLTNLTDKEASLGYVVGPPYIATASDMYNIVTTWSEFAVPVYEEYPDLLAEMYAYCLAAAHLRLPHQTAIR